MGAISALVVIVLVGIVAYKYRAGIKYYVEEVLNRLV